MNFIWLSIPLVFILFYVSTVYAILIDNSVYIIWENCVMLKKEAVGY